MKKEPVILISNDDGIYSPGIYALYRAISRIGKPIVVAPDSEKSAVGHAITISDPLRVYEVERYGETFGWAVNGTPADCVKLAIKAIMDSPPDLVVSGINHGSNTGINVIYSGTVSAATEGIIMGVPSVAFSMTSFSRKVDFAVSESIVERVVKQVLENGLPKDILLNVNIPPVTADELKGIRITRQGKGRFEEAFEKRVDPMNRTYYWLGGTRLMLDSEADIDEVAVMNQYVSVTPLHIDLTHQDSIPDLKKWSFD